MKKLLIPSLVLILVSIACGQATTTLVPADREARMPETKVSPQDDFWPPVAAPGWTQPVPLPHPVNTAGGEDSPFILPDGNTLYFWFTPDVSLPAEQQVGDGVTGIWVTERTGEGWSVPERVHLVEPSADLIDRLKADPAPPPESPPGERAVFYLSDIPPETERRAAVFMKRRSVTFTDSVRPIAARGTGARQSTLCAFPPVTRSPWNRTTRASPRAP